MTDITQRRCGQAAADVLTAPFALGDKNVLTDLLDTAGIHDAVVTLREGTMAYPTIEIFVETEVKGSPRAAAKANVTAACARLLIGTALLLGPARLGAAYARVRTELRGSLVDDGGGEGKIGKDGPGGVGQADAADEGALDSK